MNQEKLLEYMKEQETALGIPFTKHDSFPRLMNTLLTSNDEKKTMDLLNNIFQELKQIPVKEEVVSLLDHMLSICETSFINNRLALFLQGLKYTNGMDLKPSLFQLYCNNTLTSETDVYGPKETLEPCLIKIKELLQSQPRGSITYDLMLFQMISLDQMITSKSKVPKETLTNEIYDHIHNFDDLKSYLNTVRAYDKIQEEDIQTLIHFGTSFPCENIIFCLTKSYPLGYSEISVKDYEMLRQTQQALRHRLNQLFQEQPDSRLKPSGDKNNLCAIIRLSLDPSVLDYAIKYNTNLLPINYYSTLCDTIKSGEITEEAREKAVDIYYSLQRAIEQDSKVNDYYLHEEDYLRGKDELEVHEDFRR